MSDKAERFKATVIRTHAAGKTLATIVEMANVQDPQVQQALELHKEAVRAEEDAYTELMEGVA